MSRREAWGLVLGRSMAMLTSVLVVVRPAAAHISLEEGGTHRSRYGDGELKAGPCGKAGGARGTNVYTYAPGQKITVSAIETIPHPGYFRFAFDNDGDDAFIEPRSIKPIDPNRRCPNDPTDRCGMSDFYNSPAVLPGMDNLNPHLSASLGTKYTWEVPLPDVECTNCTLQLIQVMEDDLTHGPYDPTPGVGVADIYHQCIDIVLKRPDAGTGGTSDAGPVPDVRPPPVGDAGSTDGGAGGAAPDSGRSPDASGGGTGADASTTTTGAGGSPPRNDAAGGTGGMGGTSGGAAGSAAGGSGTAGGNAGGSSGGSGAGGSAGSGGAAPPGDDEGGCAIAARTRNAAGMAVVLPLVAIALVSRRRRR